MERRTVKEWRYNDGLDGPGSIPASTTILSSPQRPDVQTDSGAYPASYPMVPGLKRPGRENDHSM
jgi:hypothetical protein